MKSDGPDSKFSWVIAIACCWIYFIMYGLNRLSGLLFVDTMSTFNIERGTASYPYTLAFSLRFIAGPFAGFFAYKFGIRSVIFMGCMLTSIGTGGCFLAENIITISILWGGFVGLGSGLSTCLLKQMNNLYFKKHLVKANGIAYAGGPIAGFVLPPIVAYLLKEYSLSGTFLFLSSIAMQSFPAAIILRPPRFEQSPKEKNYKENVRKCEIHQKRDQRNSDNVNAHNLEINRNCSKYARKISNGIELKAYSRMTKNLDSSLNIDKLFTITASTLNHGNENYICSWDIEKVETTKQLDSEEDISRTFITNGIASSQVIPNGYHVFHENSLEHTNNDFKKEKIRIQMPHIMHDSNNDDLYKRDTDVLNDCSSSLARRDVYLLNTVTDNFQPFRVYFKLSFLIIGFTAGLHSFFTTIYPTILVDLIMDKGISLTKSTYALMTFSMADMIGRIALGWVTDGNYMSKASFAILLFFVYATCCSCLVWFQGFVLLSLVVFSSGICTGGLCPLFTAMVSQFIEDKYQTMANSSTELLGAPLAFAAPYLVGIFRDDLGSYNWLLYLQGMLSIISCLLLCLLPFIGKSTRKNAYVFQ